ncbi:MAG: NADH-quinone oxidoreductase subunit M [Anaerolineae bacterium]|nr:NADH-quinone oxidoreductase subunit M [Anaerolineae bacterium]NUQ06198.1 NADH-quinone oxidoreductase subunit M [Anaerolineae bacterium]
MEAIGFPVISLIIFIPIVAAVIILFIPREQGDLIKGIAITAAASVFALSLFVYLNYNARVDDISANQAALLSEAGRDSELLQLNLAVSSQSASVLAGQSMTGTQMFHDGLAFQEHVEWLPALGISYHVGVDGLNAPMVLLTGMVAVAGVLVSWRITDRTREFMAFFLLLVAGVYGVFVAIDMFLLFFFYELAIFPMYLLIATWGWVQLREYAAMKLTLYILIGSVVALVGVIAMVLVAQNYFLNEGAAVFATAKDAGILPQSASELSFSMTQITLAAENGAYNVGGYAGVETLTFAKLWFPFIFIGFGVLAGIFPFHNWSPDGHVAAPTAVSMIHAGVLMKLGAYAALRSGVQLLPQGAEVHLPWIVFLTLVNVVYGAFIAFRQRDFKYVIGFSSVSHMGLVSMGFATMNLTGMTGAGLQMFSHGAMTALFFGCVGMVYDRAHTRDIPSLGGFIKIMPWVGFAFIVGGLTSMGMPGLSGFISEFPIFQGMWRASESINLSLGPFNLSNYYSIMVIIAALGIIITAAYVLRVTSQVFFGEFDRQKYPDVDDITVRERFVLIFLGTPLVLIGTLPFIMAPMLETGLRPVLALLGGA